MECMKTMFEYFAPFTIQTLIDRAFIREFSPISALQNGTPIEFYIPGSDLLYNDLNKS